MTRRWMALGGAFALGGLSAVTIGQLDDSTRLFNTGLVGIVLAGIALTQHVNSKASIRLDELWSTAYDEGYDAGSRAAREAMRPVVVPVDFTRRGTSGRHKKVAER